MAIYGDNKHNVNEEHIDDKQTFTVKLEFEGIDAKNPLEAVKRILSWIQNEDEMGGAESFIYDVTNESTLERFLVAPAEHEENKVLLNRE